MRLQLAVCLMLLALPLVAQQSPHDPFGYERLLLPIVVPEPVPGAYSSLWRTEVVVRNESDQPIDIFQSECVYFCRCGGFQCGPLPTPPRSRFTTIFNDDLTLVNRGAYVYVPRRFSGNVSLHVRLFDESRGDRSFGTEIPVIRESEVLTGAQWLPNVPLDASFRQHMRIYGVSSDTGAGDVLLRVFTETGTTPLLEQTLVLTPAFPLPRLPFNQEIPPDSILAFPRNPAYAEVPSLGALLPDVDERVRVQLVPVTPGLRYWAFVSVTNNETQHVTLITPQ